MSTDECVYCNEAPADPGFDRCTPCRTWRDEEWAEANSLAPGSVTAHVKPGDEGKSYAEVTVRDTTLVVHESLTDPQTVNVEIDGDYEHGEHLRLHVNDNVVFDSRQPGGGNPEQVAELVALTRSLGLGEGDLDEDVHEAKAGEAAGVNNALEDQICYLLSKQGYADTETLLRRIQEDNA